MQNTHHDNEDPEFMKTVEEIRQSEEQAEQMKIDANDKAEQIMKKGKETVLKIKSATEEELTKTKNGLLQSGKETIEKEVAIIIEEAHREGEKLRKKRLKKEEVLSFMKEFTVSQ